MKERTSFERNSRTREEPPLPFLRPPLPPPIFSRRRSRFPGDRVTPISFVARNFVDVFRVEGALLYSLVTERHSSQFYRSPSSKRATEASPLLRPRPLLSGPIDSSRSREKTFFSLPPSLPLQLTRFHASYVYMYTAHTLLTRPVPRVKIRSRHSIGARRPRFASLYIWRDRGEIERGEKRREGSFSTNF